MALGSVSILLQVPFELQSTYPQNVGVIAWNIIYDVTVRLMFSIEVRREVAITGIAGKYILDAKPLKEAERDATTTSQSFCRLVKAV